MDASNLESRKDARLLPQGCVNHLTLGFWRGASIDDPSGRLESSGEVMAHVKLRGPNDIEPKLFRRWLKQARAIELSQ